MLICIHLKHCFGTLARIAAAARTVLFLTVRVANLSHYAAAAIPCAGLDHDASWRSSRDVGMIL